MDDMEATCVLYVKQSTVDQQEQSKISILTVTKMEIVMQTVQFDFVCSVSFM